MAFTLVSASGSYNVRSDERGFTQLSRAMQGNVQANQPDLARLVGSGTFKANATSTAAESGTVIDLTARGVTFRLGFMRVVSFRLWVSGLTVATENQYTEAIHCVLGATTPTLYLAASTVVAQQLGAGLSAASTVQCLMSGNSVTVQITNAETAEGQNYLLECDVSPEYAIPARPGT